MLKIRRSNYSLVFNMGITIPGKDGLYIETGPRFHPEDQVWNFVIHLKFKNSSEQTIYMLVSKWRTLSPTQVYFPLQVKFCASHEIYKGFLCFILLWFTHVIQWLKDFRADSLALVHDCPSDSYIILKDIGKTIQYLTHRKHDYMNLP